MNAGAHHRLTFATLDRLKGIPDPPPATGDEYPLPAWYRAVRETPLEELGVEDICKACRQQIHLDHVVPLALRLLRSEPLAGEMYDGELLASLKSVPSDYWLTHAAEAAMLRSVCEKVRNNDNIPNDVRQDVAELLTRTTYPRSG
ncbi:MAG: contact-dependent growth inhibition system immunity protein [Methylacidiphilales bacterium]|nr:contact-dependent growth inhibition system immunity protein [Candidatus Methylacidiphilales bacterium]